MRRLMFILLTISGLLLLILSGCQKGEHTTGIQANHFVLDGGTYLLYQGFMDHKGANLSGSYDADLSFTCPGIQYSADLQRFTGHGHIVHIDLNTPGPALAPGRYPFSADRTSYTFTQGFVNTSYDAELHGGDSGVDISGGVVRIEMQGEVPVIEFNLTLTDGGQLTGRYAGALQDVSPEDRPVVVPVMSNIDAYTTWQGEAVYLISKSDFQVNNTLLIEPGAIVKFHPTAGRALALGPNGKIVAEGTEEQPIIFTSFLDDSHGGDTNKDGDATLPAMADWDDIDLNGTKGSQFRYCQFLYGGGGEGASTLALSAGAEATISHCSFSYNNGLANGTYYGALNAGVAGRNTSIQYNTFFKNTVPLTIPATISLDRSNSFYNPCNLGQGNTYNGVFVNPTADITATVTWGETEVAYVINAIDADLSILSQGQLILDNHVVVKFLPGGQLTLSRENSLVADFYSSTAFTSFKDDSRKADTNGDGGWSYASHGDWEGIYLDTPDGGFVTDPAWSIFYDSHNE
jgi:hypothetical protein